MCGHRFGDSFKTCHCASCHETFTGVQSFDLHQRMTPAGIECRDPATLTHRDGSRMFVKHSRTQFWQENRPSRGNYLPRLENGNDRLRASSGLEDEGH